MKIVERIGAIGKGLAQGARLMVGVPDYEHYVAHMRSRHPELPVMSYEAFFRERQQARYGGGKGGPVRCC
jgi:uncharacterized short protein YbdD (DUF466 family)